MKKIAKKKCCRISKGNILRLLFVLLVVAGGILMVLYFGGFSGDERIFAKKESKMRSWSLSLVPVCPTGKSFRKDRELITRAYYAVGMANGPMNSWQSYGDFSKGGKVFNYSFDIKKIPDGYYVAIGLETKDGKDLQFAERNVGNYVVGSQMGFESRGIRSRYNYSIEKLNGRTLDSGAYTLKYLAPAEYCK